VGAKVCEPRRALRRALASWRWRDRPAPKRAVKFSSRDAPARRVVGLGRCCHAGLTFELRGRQRHDARARTGGMYRVPRAGPWRPAVGAPLERGVRHHRLRVVRQRDLLPRVMKLGLAQPFFARSGLYLH
jgi:hypothetical protein